MRIQGISIPDHVTFTQGRLGPMAEIERNGVKVRLVPNKHAELQPAPGETWKVDYQFTLQEKPCYAVAVVGVSPEPADLSALVSSDTKAEKRPKRHTDRPQTGRFVGEKQKVGRVNLDGPNVLPHVTRDMLEAAARQAALARREAPARGRTVEGVHKRSAGAAKTG